MFRGGKWRVVRWFLWRPIVPFFLEFLVLAPLVLADAPANSIGGVVFFLPWLLIVFAVINLPLLAGAFRAFRVDQHTRRNHALEHATIHFLELHTARRLAGRAAQNGFRVYGRASPQEIKKAFEQVRRMVRQGNPLPHISRRCGSNIVSALGLGLSLLLFVSFISFIVQPPLMVRASALAFVGVFFVALRHGIGNWIQRRYFMATDFDDVALRDVQEVPARPMERRPVHFVATTIRPKRGDAV